mmetsp:Transcript_1650/g.3936  ORF Transcript_1650/g.3936 Transcript_1650/m.3936 type:complete len:484 (-) Transcript_1650:79-1530(-)
MAKKKATQTSRQNGTASASSSSHVKLSLLIPGVLGVLLAAVASFMFVGTGKSGFVTDNENSPAVTPTTTSIAAETSSGRKLIVPEAGSWTDGYYTTEEVSTPAATHALLYPNGGGGGGDDEPELAAFRNEEEFLALGRLYNDLGQIVQSPSHLVNGTVLYRGPTMAGRHFQWPAVRVGYKRPVPGLVGGTGKPVELETLTEPIDGAEPRVFYVHNFLSQDEAEAFVEFSTSDDNPYKMARSTGGTHKAWNQGGAGATLKTRTSMNAFDVTTKLSYDVKKRAFRLLRLGGYQENMADGIQILRYELGQAYGDHHDYFPNTQSGDHQWDPSVGGSNRFATVFLYLSDVEFGGQTAFPKSAKLTAEKSEELVRRLGEAPSEERLATLVEEAGLDKNSWEDKLITKCYNQFAVPPRRGDAILFYSQTPDGHLDPSSLHGACPVLKGTKWGANLWVWNACRYSQCKEDPLQPAEELPKEMKAPFGGGE